MDKLSVLENSPGTESEKHHFFFKWLLCMQIQVVLGFNNLHNSASKFGKADIRALSNALETAIGGLKD